LGKLARHFVLIRKAYASGMIRVVAVVVAVTLSFDFVVLGGKYAHAARQMASAVLHSIH